MNLMKNILILVIIATSSCGLFSNSLNASNSTNHSSNRLIPITFIEMNFVTFDPIKNDRSKIQLMPLSENNTGVVYLDLKQRGFKFTFRKKEGIELKPEGDQPPSYYLEKIFKDYIGQYNMSDISTLNSIRLYQPLKDTAPFEFSQLRDQCWRVDIYPNKDINCEPGTCIEYNLNIKFCVKKHDNNLMVRKYSYLLEAKELDHTNKE